MEEERGRSERPGDDTAPPGPDETHRLPDPAVDAPAPWAQEPVPPAETAGPDSSPGGAPTTAFDAALPPVPSPYEQPPPLPVPPPPGYAPPPVYPAAPAYAPPPIYAPGTGAPPGYGGYGALPVAPAANGTALAALVCGILAIVLGCSAGPLGAIMGVVALVLANQYLKQQQQRPQQPVNPSDATYVQVGRVTGGIGLAIGLVYTVLIGCYIIFIFIAILGSVSGSSYP